MPEDQRQVSKVFYESNFVQVIEGEIDTVHASILHSRLADLDNSPNASSAAFTTSAIFATAKGASMTVRNLTGFAGACQEAVIAVLDDLSRP